MINTARDNLHTALQKYFGYAAFHPLQEEVIRDILGGRDVFVLMPTGGGKSLCYQLPAVVGGRLTVVISPLISLMKDQVDALRANGISAGYINSSLNAQEIRAAEELLIQGKMQILYVAPERLMLARFFPILQKLSPGLFAVDEAHCISEWGHDFRPEYRQLRTLRKYFPDIPIAALTATAEPRVQQDIVEQLRLRKPGIYISSFDRKNLFYAVRPKEDAYSLLLSYLSKHRGDSGIIYRQSRKSVEDLAQNLVWDGYRALPYHAGLPAEERSRNQELFIRDEAQIIVATIAFGMGINKPNVRFVIHYDLPKNIEGYYQETGRAGRDGLPSECILFYSYADRIKIEYFIDKKPEGTDKTVSLQKLREMVAYCESGLCRRKVLLGYFGEEYPKKNCGVCDNCRAPREAIDGVVIAQKILSCMKRTGERFGARYVADVLVGSANTRVRRWGHDALPTFGAGREYSIEQWIGFIRELAQQGLIDVRRGQYPTLALNEKSYAILKNKLPVELAKPAVELVPVETARDRKKWDPPTFEFLRAIRKEIARRENVPPYIIFSDATLEELSVLNPGVASDLRQVSGIGDAKMRRYGAAIFDLLLRYRRNPDQADEIVKKFVSKKMSPPFKQ